MRETKVVRKVIKKFKVWQNKSCKFKRLKYKLLEIQTSSDDLPCGSDDLPCGKMSGSGVLDSQPPSYLITIYTRDSDKCLTKNKCS